MRSHTNSPVWIFPLIDVRWCNSYDSISGASLGHKAITLRSQTRRYCFGFVAAPAE